MGVRVFNRRLVLYGSAALLTFFVAPAVAALANTDSTTESTSDEHNSSFVEVQSGGAPEVSTEPVPESDVSTGTSTTVRNDNGNVKVQVNGHEVPVEQNGTTHRTFTSNNGQTEVTVESESSSSSSSSSRTSNSSNVRINSSVNTRTYSSGNNAGGQ